MVDVLMPRLGESVAEGTVARWYKAAGDAIALREPLLEISTDKIDTEIPSPGAGTLLEILVAEGMTVAVGTVLARIGELSGDRVSDGGRESTPQAVETALLKDEHGAKSPQIGPVSRPESTIATSEFSIGRGYLSPVVQRIAAEQGVDLARLDATELAGSGIGGRITKKDLLAWLERNRSDATATGVGVEANTSNGEPLALTPLTAMRRAIAQHMVQSVRTAPHVATVFEVDMSAVVRDREAQRANFDHNGVRLTYSAYFIHAVAQALRRHPLVNDRFTEAGFVHNPQVNVGIAVALGKDGSEGLVVPVLRDADTLSLAGVAQALEAITLRARSGALLPDDMQGGTFTISNHGIGGSVIGTPIIVQPQSAILGVGAIVKRPVVVSAGGKGAKSSLLPSGDDAIVIRPICYLTLSFDHRILDGAAADGFLRDVQYQLENSNFGTSKDK